MGACKSKKISESLQQSREVDRMAAIDNDKDKLKVRLLLLGPGESGKSTIFRQMKLLYGNYSKEEKATMTKVVYTNVIQTIKVLIRKAREFHYADDQDAVVFDFLLQIDDMADVDRKIGSAVKSAWSRQSIQLAWERRNEFQVVESMSYFLNDIARISNPGYIANAQDMLHARLRSTGIIVDRFNIDGTEFEMYDVGGQRNERKKWIHCFDNISALMYVISLNEYDHSLFEDEKTNRMEDAINLFGEVCQSSHFEKSGIFLFMNKKDLYERKIKVKNIADVPEFSDYSGPAHSYNHGIQYFLEKFRSQLQKDQMLWHHVTCATDTSNIRVVFNYSREAILRSTLESVKQMM